MIRNCKLQIANCNVGNARCSRTVASFPSSAWERTCSKLHFTIRGQWLKSDHSRVRISRSRASRACVPKQSLGTSELSDLKSQRHGITLFEVVLALAIFLLAFAAVGQIVQNGSRASVDGQLQNDAVLRAQSKLAEIIAGVEPMSAMQGQAFEDDADWTWSLTMGDGPHVDLVLLTVMVEHIGGNGETDASFSINRLVRDPQLFIDAAANAAMSAEEDL